MRKCPFSFPSGVYVMDTNPPTEDVFKAIKEGKLELVKELLELDPEKNQEAFQLSAVYGQLEIMKYLITLPGVEPTARNSAFRAAAYAGHLEILQYLMTFPGVDPTACHNYSIQLASERGHLEV